MKTILATDDDLLGVERFVKRVHRMVPHHWESLFPAWYVVIFDHTKTFRYVEALQPIIKEHGYDARVFSCMAEHIDDWWSVRVILQPPPAKKFQWVLWVRHAEDTSMLQLSILGNMGDILWCTFPHLRELWAIACKREYKDMADNRPRQLFCEAFVEIVRDRRRFFLQHSPLVHIMGDIEKKVLRGELNIELKRVL